MLVYGCFAYFSKETRIARNVLKQKHIYDDGKIVLVKGYLPKSRNRIRSDC